MKSMDIFYAGPVYFFEPAYIWGRVRVLCGGGTIVIDSGKAAGSQIAVVEGKNSITLNYCTFTGAGKNGLMLYQSLSGDAAVLNLTNTELVFGSGELLNSAGNNTNNWGKVRSNGGNLVLVE